MTNLNAWTEWRRYARREVDLDMGMNVSCGDELRYDPMRMIDLIGKLELGFLVELRNAESCHVYG
jgi:hypothetical protein